MLEELFNNNLKTVVFFGDPIVCESCNRINSIINKLESIRPDNKYVFIDIHNNKKIKRKYNIIKIPTIQYYYKHKKLKQYQGILDVDTIISTIDEIYNETALLHLYDNKNISKTTTKTITFTNIEEYLTFMNGNNIPNSTKCMTTTFDSDGKYYLSLEINTSFRRNNENKI